MNDTVLTERLMTFKNGQLCEEYGFRRGREGISGKYVERRKDPFTDLKKEYEDYGL